MSEEESQREIDRCHHEIAAIGAEILAGNPDAEGLCFFSRDLRPTKRRCRTGQRSFG